MSAREWFGVRELVGLPGMPASGRHVARRAAAEGWRAQERAGRGGGREYHLASLPQETQAALLLRECARTPASEAGSSPAAPRLCRDSLWTTYERKHEGAKAEAQRRLHAVHSVERLIAEGAKKLDAYTAVAAELSESVSTIRRWLRLVQSLHRSDYLAALAPRHVGRTVLAEYSEEVWELFKADYLRLERPPATACYERVARIAAARGWVMPSRATLQRRLEREIPRQALLLARGGDDALKRSYPAQRRDRSVFHALEAVNADGHTWDVFVEWPDGERRRPAMVAVQDLYSGVILSWRVDKSENTDAVRLAVGDLLERHGIFEHIYLDNGRSFASKWLTGGMQFRHRFKVKAEDPVGLFTALGIQVHWTTPYHGQAKPIERAFGDFCNHISKHPAFAGAYTGNKPTAKPENYASRAVPLAEFLAVVEQEIAAHNQRVGRRSPVCAGRSFQQVFDESYAIAPIRRATAAQRRLWLLAAEGVTCHRDDGTIHLCGNRYWSEATAALAGQRVVVRFDPQQLHGAIHVYRLDGTYAGEAACLMAVGFNDTGAAREHGRLRRANARDAKTILERERKMSALEVAAQLPEITAPAAPATKVVRPAFGLPTRADQVGAPEPELDDERPDALVAFVERTRRQRLA